MSLKPPPSQLPQSTHAKWWVMLGVGLGVFDVYLRTRIVNIALPTLVQVFQTTFATIQWVVLSYLLVITALVLGAARLVGLKQKSDRVDDRSKTSSLA